MMNTRDEFESSQSSDEEPEVELEKLSRDYFESQSYEDDKDSALDKISPLISDSTSLQDSRIPSTSSDEFSMRTFLLTVWNLANNDNFFHNWATSPPERRMGLKRFALEDDGFGRFMNWADGALASEDYFAFDERHGIRPVSAYLSKRASSSEGRQNSEIGDLETDSVHDAIIEPISMTNGKGLPGSYSEVMFRIELEMRSILRSPAILAQFFRETLPSTIHRLRKEEAAELTPERLCDLVLIPLQRSDSNLKWTKDFCNFCGSMRSVLAEMPRDQRTSGYYLTWGALGDIAQRASGENAALLAAVIYRDVLDDIIVDSKRRTGLGTRIDENWDRIRICANNLIAKIVDHDSEELKIHRGHSPYLSALCGAINSESQVGATGGLEAWFPAGRGISPKGCSVLSQMMGVPSAWREGVAEFSETYLGGSGLHDWPAETPDKAMALMESMAGVIRLSQGDYEDSGNSFFNAGVSLLRVDRGGGAGSIFRYRSIFNFTGLFIATQGGSNLLAFQERAARSCLVNFLGALVDWQKEERRLPEEIRESLFSVVNAFPDLDGHEDRLAVYRVRSAKEQLKLEGISGNEVDLQMSMPGLYRRLVEVVFSTELHISDWPNFPENASHLIRVLWSELMDVSEFHGWLRRVQLLANGIAEVGKEKLVELFPDFDIKEPSQFGGGIRNSQNLENFLFNHSFDWLFGA